MARIITIANQKGGVAKTTTAHCMATGLTHKKYKVLAVDTDPQGNLSYIMGADLSRPGAYELFRGDIIAPDAVQSIEQGPIISGNSKLSRLSIELTGKDANNMLSEVLEPFKAVYDFIIIDTPPTLGVLSVNALSAANDIIIPMAADILALQGISQLYGAIKMVRQRFNPSLNISGILLCRYSDRTVLGRDLKQAVADRAERMGTKLFLTTIREGVSLRELQTKKISPFKTILKSRPANDYLDFINEYLEEGNNG